MRQRKLLLRSTLTKLKADVDRGVPLARAMRNQELGMSRPAVAKLLGYFKTDAVHDSLFPAWLNQDEQEQPGHYTYTGYFPVGQWVDNT